MGTRWSKNKKNNINFLLIFFSNFYNLKNLCKLHAQVFVIYRDFLSCKNENFHGKIDFFSTFSLKAYNVDTR